MNLWDNPNVSPQDAVGGLRETQETIHNLTSKSDEISFSPTMMLGLVTEVDCFKAIKELGDAKFFLKDVIKKLALEGPESKGKLDKAAQAIQQVHANQLVIVNDVCKRFGVIHPQLLEPTKEMLEHKTLYWDWYKEQHKKVYGYEPTIIEKKYFSAEDNK